MLSPSALFLMHSDVRQPPLHMEDDSLRRHVARRAY